MKYEILGSGADPTVAFLCPVLEPAKVERYYLYHLSNVAGKFMVCDLYINPTAKKTSNTLIKEYMADLIPHLRDAGIKLLVVTQPDYFKVISKQTKTDANVGDVLPSIFDGMSVTYCPNYSRTFYDPEKIEPKIAQSMKAIENWLSGGYEKTGQGIIKVSHYPQTLEDIKACLNMLYKKNMPLTVDIEGFSLKHYDAGIGTITFCWSEGEGVAFPVDYKPLSEPSEGTYGEYVHNHEVRRLLKIFFENFEETLIYHNVSYDVYVLIYQLFMEHLLDQEGLLNGLEVMLKNWDCTQLITYLATNSCAGNELGLKYQAQEFAGNYAVEEIKDITKIPLPQLLEYNLVDGLSTWYVYNKHKPTMVTDNQEEIYYSLFKPAIKDIIQMQLTGMPVNMDKVISLNSLLQNESNALVIDMESMSIVKNFIFYLGEQIIAKKNEKLKKKQIGRDDLNKTKDTMVAFNPNSSTQLQILLFSEDFLGLPILDYTKSRQPSTGAETLEKLKNHTDNKDVLDFLDKLLEYKASAIILSTFLPAFLQAKKGNDGWHYLFGNFRLGGTASGRLSSNNPNLQNIPASGTNKLKSRLAKLIKECFEAPPGWLFTGLDFDSLEDKISAVTTRDPEKIKVYSDGYDGHCLRAFAYFGDNMPDIEVSDARTFKVLIGDTEIYFHSEEIIEYEGKTMTGLEFYNLVS